MNYTTDNFDYTNNFMKYFFSYDYMKFQQLLKEMRELKETNNEMMASNNNIDSNKTLTYNVFNTRKRNPNYHSMRFTNRKTNRDTRRNNNRSFVYTNGDKNLKNINNINNMNNVNNLNNVNNVNKDDNWQTAFSSHSENINTNSRLSEDIREIKFTQKEAESKLDFLIRNLLPNKDLTNLTMSIREYEIDNFNFECLSENILKGKDQLYNCFSFKVKTDMSLSSINGANINDLTIIKDNRIKSQSPDRLISHKFFEDTQDFRNTNLMSVKTFMNNNNTATNPFCMTNKSDSEMEVIKKENTLNNERNAFSSDNKLDDMHTHNDVGGEGENNNTFNVAFNENIIEINENNFKRNNKYSNKIKIKSKSDILIRKESIIRSKDNLNEEEIKNLDHINNTETSFIKNDISISITNFSELENENENEKEKEKNIKNHISEEESEISLHTVIENNLLLTNNNLTTPNPNHNLNSNPYQILNRENSNNTITMTDINDSASLTSSRMNVERSNDKFKKVRGFNFKNNINTKKFTKPILSSQISEVSQNEINTNKSVNNNKLIDSNSISTSSITNNIQNLLNLNVNKSSNLEEKVKIKKFNFNNNINIKKFMRQDPIVKERVQQYAVEIEETEPNPISINDLTDK